MSKNTLYYLLVCVFSVALLGNKNGRASQAQKGNTGAPGDETSGGQPRTCVTCHNVGPIVASVGISVLDSAGVAITHYIPGKSYTARVTITASGPNLNGYGFQMIALKDNGNTDLDGFSDMNPNNYKIATIPGGRTYAEHDNISGSNTFNVKWTAPPTGTGSVTFYASGNGVNAGGTTSGDGAGKTSLQLFEQSSATFSPAPNHFSARVSPNPFSDQATLWLDLKTGGYYRISVFDAAGKLQVQQEQTLQQGTQQLDLPLGTLAPGLYFVQVGVGQATQCVKVVKL